MNIEGEAKLMMMAFGFCMYCLWKNRNYLLDTFHTIQSPHTTHLHILMIFSLVLAAIPVVPVCTDIHTYSNMIECTVT